MRDDSDWTGGMHRTNTSHRPSSDIFFPSPNSVHPWTANGISSVPGYARYSHHHYSNSWFHGERFDTYSQRQHSQGYPRSGITRHHHFAEKEKGGHGRGRRGSLPFPSRLKPDARKIVDTCSASSKTSSSISSTASSNEAVYQNLLKSSAANPSGQKEPSLHNPKEINPLPFYTNVPSSSISTTSLSSSSSSAAANSSTYISRYSPYSCKPSRLPGSPLQVAQNSTVSIPSVQEMPYNRKDTKRNGNSSIPKATIAYCKSIPHLRDILNKTPVVVLERLSEQLIKKQLKTYGVFLDKQLASLILQNDQSRKSGPKLKFQTHQKEVKKHQKKKLLKLILSVSDKVGDKKKYKCKKTPIMHTKSSVDSVVPANTGSSTRTSTSILVDPKVMSLSRPLQNAYSNNTSACKPFKKSGKIKNPSKILPAKSYVPPQKQMHMFDLEKLRTKLMGANFGGSARKVKPILNFHQHSKNTESVPVVEESGTDRSISSETLSTNCILDTETDDNCNIPVLTKIDDECEETSQTDPVRDRGPKEEYVTTNDQEVEPLHKPSSPNSVGIFPEIKCDFGEVEKVSEDSDEPPVLEEEIKGEESLNQSSESLEMPDVTGSAEASRDVDTNLPSKSPEEESKENSQGAQASEENLVCEKFEATDSLIQANPVKDPNQNVIDFDTGLNKCKTVKTSDDFEVQSGTEVLSAADVLHPESKQDIDVTCQNSSVDFVVPEEVLDTHCQEDKSLITATEFSESTEHTVRCSSECVSTQVSNSCKSDSVPTKENQGNGKVMSLAKICQIYLQRQQTETFVDKSLTDLVADVHLGAVVHIPEKEISETEISGDKILTSSNSVSSECLGGLQPDHSITRSDGYVSPVCVITSVESGAHIYFSEHDDDLKDKTLNEEVTDVSSVQVSSQACAEETDQFCHVVATSDELDVPEGIPCNPIDMHSETIMQCINTTIINSETPSNEQDDESLIDGIHADLSVIETTDLATKDGVSVVNSILQTGSEMTNVSVTPLQDIPLSPRPTGVAQETSVSQPFQPITTISMILPTKTAVYPGEDNYLEHSMTTVSPKRDLKVVQSISESEQTVTQDFQQSNSVRRIESDLDVMHYNDNPEQLLPDSKRTETGQIFEMSDLTSWSMEVDNTTEGVATLICTGTQDNANASPGNLKSSELEDRVEVGRLFLKRAHRQESDDSDATLIYSCDEDNDCFKEIFPEPGNHLSASKLQPGRQWDPSMYEGKLVIVTDKEEESGEGKIILDTTNNDRLSLVITTLRKDIKERKEQKLLGQLSHIERHVTDFKTTAGNVRKRKSKSRKNSRKTHKSLAKRENLIVTIQRKKIPKTDLPAVTNTTDDTKERKIVKKTKVFKNRHKLKKQMSVSQKNEVSCADPLSEQKPEVTDEVVHEGLLKCKRVIKRKRKVSGRKRVSAAFRKMLKQQRKREDQDINDSDELPTILPPRRRRLQKPGNILMMMQNTVSEKENSSERIMREFPRHNWLEQKINHLQQQTSHTPSSEEDMTHDSHPSVLEKHVPSPGGTQFSEPVLDKADSPASSANVEVTSPSSSPGPPPLEPEADVAHVRKNKEDESDVASVTNSQQDNRISLDEAVRLVCPEDDNEDKLVVDEDCSGEETRSEQTSPSQTEGSHGILQVEGENSNIDTLRNDEDKNTSTTSEEMQKCESREDSTPKTAGSGQPLDLCLRHGSGGEARPVQMVLPQIQQPIRPASNEPSLVKETKEAVQNFVVKPHVEVDRVESNEGSEHVLNLSQSGDTPPILTDLIKGIVLPVRPQETSDIPGNMDRNSLVHPFPANHSDPSRPAVTVVPSSETQAETGANVQTPSSVSPGLLAVSSQASSITPNTREEPSGVPKALSVSPPHGPENRVFSMPVNNQPGLSTVSKDLDTEFERHFREFKQLEILAAKKEREREALLMLKKQKAMMLNQMKFKKTQQQQSQGNDSVLQGSQNSHAPLVAQGQELISKFPLNQNRLPCEHRPVSTTSRLCAEKITPYHPNTHSLHSVSHPLNSLTASADSNPLSLIGHSSRKRPISDERHPIVQMINLAMLQRRRKQRRLTEDSLKSGLDLAPVPAHQNKSETVVNPERDVPSSELTHCPYRRRKTPILEPPSSTRPTLSVSAAPVPAHTQPPFQTAGSLIVPVRNIPVASPTGPNVPGFRHQAQAPTSEHQSITASMPQFHRGAVDVPSNPSSLSQDANYVSQGMSPFSHRERLQYSTDYNTNSTEQHEQAHPPPPHPPHLGPGMSTPVSQSSIFQQPPAYGINQPIRPGSAQPSDLRPVVSHPLSVERPSEVIDLTRETENKVQGNGIIMPGNLPIPTGMERRHRDDNENTVQRELGAALAARRQTFPNLEQHPQTQVQQMNRPSNLLVPHSLYPGSSPSGSQNSSSPEALVHRQNKGPLHAGNPMASPTDVPYSLQLRQAMGGSQYQAVEAPSVRPPLISPGSKLMVPTSYKGSTTSTSSYVPAQFQQQQRMPVHVSSVLPGEFQRMSETSSGSEFQPLKQMPHTYREQGNRDGQMTTPFKPPPQPVNWRPSVPVSVSNIPISLEKQQQLMMAYRGQWEQYSLQRYQRAQKTSNILTNSPMRTPQASIAVMPPPTAFSAPTSQSQEPLQPKPVMHHPRMMARTPVPPVIQMQQMHGIPGRFPRERGTVDPLSATSAPALIEFTQEGQRRITPVPIPQQATAPRLHQYNGACVVCGAVAMYLCSTCRRVWYCSQGCQNNHWRRHSVECKPAKPMMPGQLS